jgi:type IV pilus assembly protein PilA
MCLTSQRGSFEWRLFCVLLDQLPTVQGAKDAWALSRRTMKMMTSRKQKGFSLIELLIVVAIILIIAAIAIPNLIRARIAANQSSAAASLRTIASASAMYQSTYQDGYPGTLTVMAPAAPVTCDSAGLLDNILSGAASPTKSGYTFTFTAGTQKVNPIPTGCTNAGFSDMFSVNANPASASTGTEFYCVDATNVIRQSNAAVAVTAATGCDPAATPIGN